MVYKAEYIWIDGTEPTAKLRSKTKILEDGAELSVGAWVFLMCIFAGGWMVAWFVRKQWI